MDGSKQDGHRKGLIEGSALAEVSELTDAKCILRSLSESCPDCVKVGETASASD